MRKIISVCLTLVMLIVFVLPASASEIIGVVEADVQQDKADYINELISLAGRAAREGDLETAQMYEAELVELGVDIVVTNDPATAQYELGLTDVAPTAVPMPTNTNAVHWYRTGVTGYYNAPTAKYYDIITLRAESWDDTSNIMHRRFIVSTNESQTGFMDYVSATAYTVAEFIVGLNPVAGAALTLGDFAVELAELIGLSKPCTVYEFSGSANSCTWIADVSYTFYYVRYNNSGAEYLLSCVEGKAYADYTAVIEVGCREYENGPVDSELLSIEVKDIVYQSTSYGAYYKVCAAYTNGVVRRDFIPYADIKVLDYEYSLPYIQLPADPSGVS